MDAPTAIPIVTFLEPVGRLDGCEFVDVEGDDCAADVPVPVVPVADATPNVPVEKSLLQKL
jgi:hypothetical protein